MALRITSLGPLDYRTVRLRVVQPPENLRPPIKAVMFEHVWGQEVDLGPLRRGEVAEVLCGGRTPQRAHRSVGVHLPEPVEDLAGAAAGTA
jgi:hypothetical protein